MYYTRTRTRTHTHTHTHLDTEVMGFMNGDVHKDSGMFYLFPSWCMQMDMTITYTTNVNTYILYSAFIG